MNDLLLNCRIDSKMSEVINASGNERRKLMKEYILLVIEAGASRHNVAYEVAADV